MLCYGGYFLLHIKKMNMKRVLSDLISLLNFQGVLYASWKYGDCERDEDGKHYSDYNENQLRDLINMDGISNTKIWTSKDQTRVGTCWINLLVYKDNK